MPYCNDTGDVNISPDLSEEVAKSPTLILRFREFAHYIPLLLLILNSIGVIFLMFINLYSNNYYNSTI